jgi:hypothetical protein
MRHCEFDRFRLAGSTFATDEDALVLLLGIMTTTAPTGQSAIGHATDFVHVGIQSRTGITTCGSID